MIPKLYRIDNLTEKEVSCILFYVGESIDTLIPWKGLDIKGVATLIEMGGGNWRVISPSHDDINDLREMIGRPLVNKEGKEINHAHMVRRPR